MPGLRVSARSSAEIRATLLAIKTLDRDLRRELRSRTRKLATVDWERAMSRHASTELERRVLVDTARVSVSDQNVRIRSAGSSRPAGSGGIVPRVHGRGVEFGSSRTRSLPRRRRQGYVFFPAAADMIPQLLALWVQTTVRTIAEALEAGGKK
jgi:hypothetical protein